MQNQGNFFTARGNNIDDVAVKVPDDEKGYYATIATTDHALDCLKEHAANYKDRPFFHYIPYIAPHFPLHALPEDIAKYRDKYLAGWDAMRAARFAKQKQLGITNTTLSPLEREVGPPYAFPDAIKQLGPGEVNRPLPWTELTDEQHRFQATKMAIHAAMVDRMDREIGRIIANSNRWACMKTRSFVLHPTTARVLKSWSATVVTIPQHRWEVQPVYYAWDPVFRVLATRRIVVTNPGFMKEASRPR